MRRWGVILLVVIGAAGMAQANLLVNAGYESVISSNWSPTAETTNWFGWGDVESVDAAWKTPHSGSKTLVMKNWLGGNDGLEQKPDILGNQEYDLEYYSLWDGGYDGTMLSEVRWLDSGGNQVGSNMVSWTKGANDTWTRSYAVITSHVSSTRAEINFQNTGGSSGALYLDDVNFDVVPEPSTIVLFGLAGVALWYRRCRRA